MASSANAVPVPNAPITTPPSAGPASLQRDRAHHLVERVRLRQPIGRQQLGHDRVERGREERRSRAVEDDQHDDVPDLERAGEREHRQQPDRDGPHQVCREHDAPAVEPVAGDAADEQEDDRRHGHRDADERHRGRGVGELVDLPRERHEERAVPQQRDAHPAPEQAELAVAQRRQQPGAGEPAGRVERLVAMEHRRRALPRAPPGTPASRRHPSDVRSRSPGPSRIRGRAASATARGTRSPPRPPRG